MKCEICNQGPSEVDGPSVFRVNPKGVKGIWRCQKHLTEEQSASIDSETKLIVSILEGTDDLKKGGE